MNTLKTSTTVLATLVALACSGNAAAVLVDPNSTVSLPGTTAAAEPNLAGLILLDETFNFSLQATPGSTEMITGTVQQRVVRETNTGFLDFYWRVYDIAGGSLGYFRIGNFNSDTFDANFRIDGVGDVSPSSIHRFAGDKSSYVNFNFVDAAGGMSLHPGQSSNLFFLHTTATDYNYFAFFDLGSAGTYTMSQSFAALTPVPEPETYAMLMAGLGLIGAVARRRKS